MAEPCRYRKGAGRTVPSRQYSSEREGMSADGHGQHVDGYLDGPRDRRELVAILDVNQTAAQQTELDQGLGTKPY